jgi:hypothetical protein
VRSVRVRVRVRVCFAVRLEINWLCATPVANWALSIGLKEKDVVALMMDNRPEFIFMWYAPSPFAPYLYSSYFIH